MKKKITGGWGGGKTPPSKKLGETCPAHPIPTPMSYIIEMNLEEHINFWLYCLWSTSEWSFVCG